MNETKRTKRFFILSNKLHFKICFWNEFKLASGDIGFHMCVQRNERRRLICKVVWKLTFTCSLSFSHHQGDETHSFIHLALAKVGWNRRPTFELNLFLRITFKLLPLTMRTINVPQLARSECVLVLPSSSSSNGNGIKCIISSTTIHL